VRATAVALAVLMPAAAAAQDPVPISERTRGLHRHHGFVPYYWDAEEARREGDVLAQAHGGTIIRGP
jgi:hypothetical protein